MMDTAPLSDLAVLASSAAFVCAGLLFAFTRSTIAAPATSARVSVHAGDVSPRAHEHEESPPLGLARSLRAAWCLFAVGTGSVLLAIGARGLSAGRAPWGNMYEFALVAVAVMALLAVAWPSIRSARVAEVTSWAAAGLLMSSALLLWVPAGPLVPALQSYWLVVHVLAALIATGAFLLGSITSTGYLIRTRGGRAPDAAAERLDERSRKLHAFAFPIWTFAALIAGPIWAKYAWGRYWAWDPKEVWAFITWVVYAGYLHARATAGVSPRRSAAIALVGVGTLLFSFIGVNVWGSGLHSYGGL